MRQFKNARLPGPIGQSGQDVPGVSSRDHWQQLIPGPINIHLLPNQATKVAQASVKKFQLPALEQFVSGNHTKNINEIDWPLYSKKGKEPHLNDVKQGMLLNCPLAAILAALAHTAKGRTHIKKMITEFSNVTTETKYTGKDGVDGKTVVQGKRYFSVKFNSNKPIKISSVFYTDEQSSPKMIYMTPPTDVLWPCVIEKAYAKLKGGYNKLGGDPAVYWKDIVGSYKYLNLKKDASPKVTDKEVFLQVKQANIEPMIASLEGQYHGFAVKGIGRKSKIVLHDPASLKDTEFTIEYLRKEEETVFWYGGI